jgi:hypothetical protein
MTMKKVWPWIFGIAVGLIIITLLVYTRSNHNAYWSARDAYLRQIQQVHQTLRFPGSINFATQTPTPPGLYDWKK